MTVNANAPTLLGYEPMMRRQRGFQVTKDRTMAAVITPGAVATDDIALRLRDVHDRTTINVDVMKVSDMTPAGGVSTVSPFVPTGDGGFAGAGHAGGGTVGPFYVDVDEAVLNTADYVTNQSTTNQVWSLLFGTGAFPAGRRILDVRFWMVATGSNGFGADTIIAPWFSNGASTEYELAPFTVGLGNGTYSMHYPVNPITGLPWTQADIVAFAATSLFGFDLFAPAVTTFKMFQAGLDVTWVPETRLATGSLTVQTDGWKTVPMATPAGVDTWTPVAATQYAVIVSVPSGDDGTVTWEALDAGVAHPDVSTGAVTLDGNGFPVGVDASDTAVAGFVGINGAGTGLWGQPFVGIVEEAVYSGRTVEKEVTSPNTDDRGSVKLVVRQQSRLTTAPLVVRLRRRSDNVQKGGDVIVTPNEVRDGPLMFQTVVLPMVTAATGLTAVQHFVECSCVGVSGEGWVIETITAFDAGYATIGRANVADLVTVGGVDAPEREIPITLAKARAAPTGLTAVPA